MFQTSDNLQLICKPNLSRFLLMIMCISFATSDQVDAQAQAQAYIEVTRPIKLNGINNAPSAPELFRGKQNVDIQPTPSKDPSTIRLTLTNESANHGGYNRFETMLGAADRLVNAISRPANVINLIRFVILALSSLLMSTIIFPLSDLSKTRTTRLGQNNEQSNQNSDNIIELMIKSYDETMKRAGINDKSVCRERTLCVMGDLMACDFPSLTFFMSRLTQNYLLPIEANKNKYTKALMLGLNQTNCDRVYHATSCPSLRDNVKTYFYGTRRRRDRFNWRKQ